MNILPPEQWATWLSPQERQVEKLLPRICPLDSETIQAWPVSRDPNKAGLRDDVGVIEPSATFPIAPSFRRPLLASILAIATLANSVYAGASEELRLKIDGDVGLGGYYTHSIIRGDSDKFNVLPYLDFDYSRIFARIDTLGVKTLKLGYGYLEFVGRVSQDNFSLQGLSSRDTSIPLGIGTFQETPIGVFVVNTFHDVNQSKGNLLEAIYGGELDLPRVIFYPLIGAEYQSKEYVSYYYGISTQEAAIGKYAAYKPAGSINSLIGLIADFRLTEAYHLNCQVRQKWLGNAIRSSPIVSRGHLDTGYLSLSYRFK